MTTGSSLPPLSDLSDAELDRLEQAIAAERDKRRRQQQKDAEKRIKELAEKAGLTVSIRERKKPPRKRKPAAA